MPLCYGGGITTVAQAKDIIAMGVEKVALSSSAVASPQLVTEISEAIGRQSVAVVIDVRKRLLGGLYDVYTHNGRRKARVTALDFAEAVAAAGAGEIVVNVIDRDGMMSGYDLALARDLRARVGVPISLLGGAGSLADLEALINEVGVVGAAAGSLFVFKGQYRAVLINYPNPAAKEDLVLRAMGAC
jgi:cyclase